MPIVTIPPVPLTGVNYSSPVVKGLHQCIANGTALTQLNQIFHWGVKCREFKSLHEMAGAQYDAAFESVDWFAERIRALGSHVDGAYLVKAAEFSGMPSLQAPFDTELGLGVLIAAYEKNEVDLTNLARIAKEVGDAVTENALYGHIESTQKTLWMLRSTL